MKMIVEEIFGIEYTGGGVYIAYGQFSNGLYFTIGCDCIFCYNENEWNILDNENVDVYEWEQQHQIKLSINEQQFLDILKQVYNKCNDKDKDSMDLFRINNIEGNE